MTPEQKRRKKSALKLADQLDKSVESMVDYIRACNDLGDARTDNADDGRNLLKADMAEYAHWLRIANWDRT